MRWKNLWLVSLCVGGFHYSVSAATEVTSSSLRDLVKQGNANLKAQSLEVQASEVRTGALARSFLPVLEASAGGETFKKGREDIKSQPTYGIEARVNLWNAGRDKMTSDIRNLEMNGERLHLRRTEAEALGRAAELYWQILFVRDWIESLRQAQKLNQNSLVAADRRIRSGVATQIDRLEFEMQSAELGRTLKAQELEFEILQERLALVLGISGPLVFKEKFAHSHDFEKAIEHTEQDMDYWLAADQVATERSQLEAKHQGRSWWPRLEAFAGYRQHTEREEDYPDPIDRSEAYVGMKWVMNLSAGLEDQKWGRAKGIQAEAQKIRLEQDRREMNLHMKAEMKELRRLHDQVHDFEDNILRAERYHQMTQSEYGRGVRNSPDVLGSNLKLLEARQKRLMSIRDFQIAKAHFLAKLGR